ncbi:hypothetical protein QWY93_07330 [Echinicola jeungdonensis]|uniref:DUF6970 domain-containing protein n=1 Tax=Echinicola jeungdonensis TaxID=709343 RepID=A0ABV5J7A7_9BACT|nr:hypothetical protein [Echinicola jeungdonensis]MDN3669136.1 hypothetical protein [Echinicola jeungdonensis]
MKIKLISSFILSWIIAFSLTSCEETSWKAGVPDCVISKIKTISQQEVSNPPTEVWKWEVDGQTYYYFTSPCCDQFDYLYDGECQQVCAPDGGITGQGDGNCPDFEGEIEKTLIWKDERQSKRGVGDSNFYPKYSTLGIKV